MAPIPKERANLVYIVGQSAQWVDSIVFFIANDTRSVAAGDHGRRLGWRWLIFLVTGARKSAVVGITDTIAVPVHPRYLAGEAIMLE